MWCFLAAWAVGARGAFVAVAAGGDPPHTCALEETNATIVCWGDDQYGESSPPDGRFIAVDSGWAHTCGIREGGSVACWGKNSHGEGDAPDGTFSAISAGYGFTCGVKQDGRLACWGQLVPYPQYKNWLDLEPPEGKFTSVEASEKDYWACALREDQGVTCWGKVKSPDEEYSWGFPPSGVLFKSLSSGVSHLCGITVTDELSCWGADTSRQATPPAGKFRAVSASDKYTCGVRENGRAECWGLDLHGRASPPEYSFLALSAGKYHTCGVLETGRVVCWGKTGADGPTPPADVFCWPEDDRCWMPAETVERPSEPSQAIDELGPGSMRDSAAALLAVGAFCAALA